MSNVLVDQLIREASAELEAQQTKRRQARNKRKAARRKAKENGLPPSVVPAMLGLGGDNTPRLEMQRPTPPKGATPKGNVAKDKDSSMKARAKQSKSKSQKRK
jgi:hypothetical protein